MMPLILFAALAVLCPHVAPELAAPPQRVTSIAWQSGDDCLGEYCDVVLYCEHGFKRTLRLPGRRNFSGSCGGCNVGKTLDEAMEAIR